MRFRLIGDSKQILTNSYKGLGFIMAIYLSIMFAMFYDNLNKNSYFITPKQLLIFLNGGILIYTILKEFVPSYIPQTNFFPKIIPIRPWKKIIISMFYEVTKIYYISLFSAVTIISLFSDYFPLIEVFKSIVLIFFTIPLVNSIKILIERKIEIKSIIFSIAAFSILFFGLVNIYEQWDTSIYIVVSIIFTISFITYWIMLEAWNNTYANNTPSIDFNNTFLQKNSFSIALLFNNIKIRTVIFTFLILKIAALSSFYLTFGSDITDENMLFIIIFLSGFISPLPFTVIIYNFLGFYRNLWITVEIHTGSINKILKNFLSISLALLSIDIPFTLLFAFFFSTYTLFICIFYFTVCLIVLLYGMISSIYYPLRVQKANLKFGGQTSSRITVWITYLITILFMLPLINSIFYILYPIVIILYIYMFKNSLANYKLQKFEIFIKLFKN